MASLWSDEATAEIDAPPTLVWSLVSDITRTGEWSPVCRRCEWIGEAASPMVGARFVGHNRQLGARWSRVCVITASEPGRAFEFHTMFRGRASTRWRYRLEPTARGTHVVESYEMLAVPRWVQMLQRLPGMSRRARRDARHGMELTLLRLKSTAESSP